MCLTKNYRRVLQHVHNFCSTRIISDVCCAISQICGDIMLRWSLFTLWDALDARRIRKIPDIDTYSTWMHTYKHTCVHSYVLTDSHYIYIRGTTPRPILSQNLLICAMFCCLFPCLNVWIFWSLINGKEFDYTGGVEFKESLVNNEELSKEEVFGKSDKKPQ